MKALSRLWLLLLSFLTLAVGDDPTDDEPQTLEELIGASLEPDPSDDPDDDDEPTQTGGGGADPNEGEDPAAALKAERKARKEAETRAANERAERERIERERPAPQAPTQRRDPVYDAEEERLAALRKDPAVTPEQLRWAQWQIDSDRNIRKSNQDAAEARRYSEDTADKAAFDRLEQTKPKLYRRYAERVEQTLRTARANGNNAPRMVVLKLLLGEDMIDGKIKPKAAKPKPAGGDEPARTVDRGRMPGARSDTNGRGGQSEREKRRARLENQII